MKLSAETLNRVREIFFLSSNRKKFASEDERDDFFKTWTDYYFKFCPELILFDHDGAKIRGYLMGCADSASAELFYRDRLKSYAVFANLFSRFPGHLHINVHPDGRSQGVGARLIAQFEEILKKRGVRGLHIVTSPESANTAFYLRNGFSYKEIRDWQNHSLLFMGKTLTV